MTLESTGGKKMETRYDLVNRIEMSEDNKKLQSVLDHFNSEIRLAPGTYLDCCCSETVEGYSLQNEASRGRKGIGIDLDVRYEDVEISDGTEGRSVLEAFPLGTPGWLQAYMAANPLDANLSIHRDNGTVNLARYEFSGDRIIDAQVGPASSWTNLPREYLQKANNIREGDYATKAVDLGFALWTWDHGM